MNWDEDQGAGKYPNAFYFYLPRICNHCAYPACLDACPRNAIYKRKNDGAVVIDQDRCKGYRFCLEACPYKVIYFNFVQDVSMKCIFCYPRLEEKVPNACARQCTGRVRWVGFVDEPKSLIYKLVKVWKVALPLHAEYGTNPNVFYVPPLAPPRLDKDGKLDLSKPRIPRKYLRFLFGPEVDAALGVMQTELDKVRTGGKSELMEILIAREWSHMFGPFDKDPASLERKPDSSAKYTRRDLTELEKR
jgi:ethylbenzene hydroxylase subunit beta/complex iron-sulfur molybdoenzyme family reductase subunit beta